MPRPRPPLQQVIGRAKHSEQHHGGVTAGKSLPFLKDGKPVGMIRRDVVKQRMREIESATLREYIRIA
jgi:hypothetical protein